MFGFGKHKELAAENLELKKQVAEFSTAVTEASPQNGLKLSEMTSWNDLIRGEGGVAAGIYVDEKTAMRISAVYASIRLIAGTIGSLPIHVYERTPNGRKEAHDHPATRMLGVEPNGLMGPTTFWECVLTHALLKGNNYGLIGRYRNGDPYSISPVSTERVSVDLKNGRLQYAVSLEDGKYAVFDQDDVFHIPAVGWDGKKGLSPLQSALKESAGIARAADQYSGNFFVNGARPDGVITYPNKLDKEQADLVRDYWFRKHQGVEKAHLPAVLSEGGKYTQLSLSAEDAQLLQTRSYQIADIARIFGVPPHMIGHVEKTTSWGSGIEQLSIGFAQYTLKPWTRKIRDELQRKIIRDDKYYAEHNLDGLLEGDSKTRHETYKSGIGGNQIPGYMTVNEVRRLENLPPKDGGDELYRPPEGKTNEPEETV